MPRPTVPSVFEFWPGEGFGDVAPPLFRGMVQHRRQRRQKIADDCPRFLALKALGDNLIGLRLINLIDEARRSLL